MIALTLNELADSQTSCLPYSWHKNDCRRPAERKHGAYSTNMQVESQFKAAHTSALKLSVKT